MKGSQIFLFLLFCYQAYPLGILIYYKMQPLKETVTGFNDFYNSPYNKSD